MEDVKKAQFVEKSLVGSKRVTPHAIYEIPYVKNSRRINLRWHKGDILNRDGETKTTGRELTEA